MNYKSHVLAAFLVVAGSVVSAQTVTIERGGSKTDYEVRKGSEMIPYSAGDKRYFVEKYFQTAINNFIVRGFDGSGNISSSKLEINPGSYSDGFIVIRTHPLGDKHLALVENVSKPTGKNNLLAREISAQGKVATEQKELMSFPYEKKMNSGYHHSAVSPDQKTLAIVSELPYQKDQSAELKIAVYDAQLNKLREEAVKLPGEDTKNKNISMATGNNGTVYIIKKINDRKAGIQLSIFKSVPGAAGKLIESNFQLEEPNEITSYTFTTAPSGELILAGTYSASRVVTVGGAEADGIFYFATLGGESVFKTSKLNQPVKYLTAQEILTSGNMVYFTASQYQAERQTPAGNSTMTLDYDYLYSHGDNYVFGLDASGNKKFEVSAPKNASVMNFDHPYHTGYFIVNDQLTMVYNDAAGKYSTSYHHTNLVPLMVQITNEGLMKDPVVFIDKLAIPREYSLYPAHSVQDGNTLIFLMGNGKEAEELKVIVQ